MLSKYILALLKKQEAVDTMRAHCATELRDFLEGETEGFVRRLFEYIADELPHEKPPEPAGSPPGKYEEDDGDLDDEPIESHYHGASEGARKLHDSDSSDEDDDDRGRRGRRRRRSISPEVQNREGWHDGRGGRHDDHGRGGANRPFKPPLQDGARPPPLPPGRPPMGHPSMGGGMGRGVGGGGRGGGGPMFGSGMGMMEGPGMAPNPMMAEMMMQSGIMMPGRNMNMNMNMNMMGVMPVMMGGMVSNVAGGGFTGVNNMGAHGVNMGMMPPVGGRTEPGAGWKADDEYNPSEPWLDQGTMRHISQAEMMVAQMRQGGAWGKPSVGTTPLPPPLPPGPHPSTGLGAAVGSPQDQTDALTLTGSVGDSGEHRGGRDKGRQGARGRAHVPHEPPNETIASIYVSGAPEFIPNFKEMMTTFFSRFGEVVDVRAFANTGRAFVQFANQAQAKAALAAPETLNSRSVRVTWAYRDNSEVNAAAAEQAVGGGTAKGRSAHERRSGSDNSDDDEGSDDAGGVAESEEERRQREDMARAQAERLEELKAEKESTVGRLTALEAEKRALREKLHAATMKKAPSGGVEERPPQSATPGSGGGVADRDRHIAAEAGREEEDAPPGPELTEAEKEALEKAKAQKLSVAKAAAEAEAKASELRAKYEALLRAKKRSTPALGGAPATKKGRYKLDFRPTTIAVKLPQGTPPGAGEEVAKQN